MTKYPSIMSLTNFGGKIRRMSEEEIEKLRNLSLFITEKVDGENYRVGIDENGRQFIGQRNMIYYRKKEEDGTYGFYLEGEDKPHPRWNSFSKATKMGIEKIHEYIKSRDVQMTFFGELFGKGVQKRFTFDVEGLYVVYFEVSHEGNFFQPQTAFELLEKLGLLTVPFIGIMTVKELLDFDVESLKSKVANEDYVEGVVGVPVNGVPTWWDFGDRLIIKKKTLREDERTKRKSKKGKKNKYESPFTQFANIVRMEHVIAVLEEKGLEITSDKECRQKVITSFVYNIRKEENEGKVFSKEDQRAITTEGHRIFSKYLASLVVL